MKRILLSLVFAGASYGGTWVNPGSPNATFFEGQLEPPDYNPWASIPEYNQKWLVSSEVGVLYRDGTSCVAANNCGGTSFGYGRTGFTYNTPPRIAGISDGLWNDDPPRYRFDFFLSPLYPPGLSGAHSDIVHAYIRATFRLRRDYGWFPYIDDNGGRTTDPSAWWLTRGVDGYTYLNVDYESSEARESPYATPYHRDDQYDYSANTLRLDVYPQGSGPWGIHPPFNFQVVDDYDPTPEPATALLFLPASGLLLLLRRKRQGNKQSRWNGFRRSQEARHNE